MTDTLLSRHLRGEIETALASARVVNVVGPRQAGKTTLVRDLLGGGRYISLDDESVLAAIERDPYGQLAALAAEAGDQPVIIDEAQRSRNMALAMKRLVDERRRPGQFLLTGSSNVFTAAHVADSLAGRVLTLTLLPLSAAEIHRAGPTLLLDWACRAPTLAGLPAMPAATRDSCIDLVVRGGYPETRGLDARRRQAIHRATIDTIVDRDVADVMKIRKSDSLRRLIDQLAARTAGEINVQELCSVIGIQRPTIEQYLDILSRLSLVVRLGTWASGEVGRETRHPKIHFLDTGIVAALRNLAAPSNFTADANPTALGGLLESWVHGELVKALPYQRDAWHLYHWRDRRGHEVDILADCGRDLVAIEVKASTTVNDHDLRNLRWFLSGDGPGRNRNATGIIVYLGNRPLGLGERIFALPMSMFWATGWKTAS